MKQFSNVTHQIDKGFRQILKALSKTREDDPKRGKLKSDFIKQRSRVHEPAAGRAMEKLHHQYARKASVELNSEPRETLDLICELKTAGFIKAADWFFCERALHLSGVGADEIICAAPNGAALEFWRKKNGISPEELEDSMPEIDLACYTTAGGDWLLTFGSNRRQQKMVALCLAKQARPGWLPQGADGLIAALKKDKKNEMIRQFLEGDSYSNEQAVDLATLIRHNTVYLMQLSETLPKTLCSGAPTSRKTQFINDMFAGVSLKDEKERGLHYASLARLGSGILMLDRKCEYARYMECIEGLGRELREATGDEQGDDTWILGRVAGADNATAGQNLSMSGARQLASALMKINKSKNPGLTLGATARNLGMSNIGQVGDVDDFNPTHHEDVEGGRMRGDRIEIIEPGWEFDAQVLVRAKIRRKE